MSLKPLFWCFTFSRIRTLPRTTVGRYTGNEYVLNLTNFFSLENLKMSHKTTLLQTDGARWSRYPDDFMNRFLWNACLQFCIGHKKGHTPLLEVVLERDLGKNWQNVEWSTDRSGWWNLFRIPTVYCFGEVYISPGKVATSHPLGW